MPTIIDSGSLTVTNQRAVFQGSKRTTEWLFSKLVGVTHAETKPWTSLQVTNRQKVAGFTYRLLMSVAVHLWLAIAPELYLGKGDEVRAELHEQLAELDKEPQGDFPNGELS